VTKAAATGRNGPTPAQKALAFLGEEKGAALRKDLEELYTTHNQATDGTTRVEAEYLEVVARRA